MCMSRACPEHVAALGDVDLESLRLRFFFVSICTFVLVKQVLLY
jgi:hypothetical protein